MAQARPTAGPRCAGGNGASTLSSSRTATPMMASETSRCRETTHGFRSVSTVMPPMTACAGMIRPIRSDIVIRSRRPIRHAARKVATAITASTPNERAVPELDGLVVVAARRAAGTTRPCTAARSGSPGPRRSGGRRRPSRRSRCWRPGWPRPAAGSSARRPVSASLPRERPGRGSGPHGGPGQEHERGPARRRVPSRNASRIASPSAPEGSHWATSPKPPYADAGSTTAPAASSSR